LELPYDAEDYVHRIGRTGRAGRKGKAFSLVAGREIYLMQRIQRFINTRVERAKVPSQEEVEATRVDQAFEKVKAVLEGGEFTSHEHSIQRLLDIGFTATDISSALMDLLMKDQGRESEQIMEDRAGKKKEVPQREFKPRPQPAVEAAAPAPVPAAPEGAESNAPAVGTPVQQTGQEHDESGPANQEAAAKPAPARFDNEFNDAGDDESLPKKQRSFAQRGPRSGMVRLFINVGGMDMVRPSDIAGMLYNTIQDLRPSSIGTIDVVEKCSFVEVPEDSVEAVLEGIKQQGAVIRGREVRMDYADRPGDAGQGIGKKYFGGGGGFKKGGFGGGGYGGGGGFKKPGFGNKPGGFGGGGGYGGGGFKKPGFGGKPKPWLNRDGEGPSPGYGGGGGDYDGGPRREDAGGGYGGGFKKPGGFGGGKRFGGGGGFKKKW